MEYYSLKNSTVILFAKSFKVMFLYVELRRWSSLIVNFYS